MDAALLLDRGAGGMRRLRAEAQAMFSGYLFLKKVMSMSEQWKFFVIKITYRVPVEDLGDALSEHRAFL